MRRYLALALLATACKVEGGDVAPLQAGNGIVVGEKNLVSVDASRVPVLPSCEGGFLSKQGDSWKCLQVDASDVHGLSDQLAAKLGKDEAAATYLKTADADAKFALDADLQGLEAAVYTKAAANAAFATKEELAAATADADAKFATKTALQDYYTKIEADGLFALKTHTHTLADLGAASAADLGALTTKVEDRTKSVFQANVLNGGCVTATHGWNTRGVGYSAWYSDPAAPAGTMVPAQPGYEPGTTNLALNRPATASSVSSNTSYGVQGVVDGIDSAFTNGWEASAGSGGWWEVDLGSVRPISTVKVLVSLPGQSWAATAYEVLLSNDGQNFGQPVVAATCTKPGTCEQYQELALPSGTAARYVRINATNFVNGAHLTEVAVFGSAYTVSMPDANNVKFCNYTGIARDLSLTVWH